MKKKLFLSGKGVRLIGVVFIFLLQQIIFAQGTKFLKYDYKWENEIPPSIPLEEKYKNDDAVILQEENMIWIGKRQFSRHLRIKYLNADGVKRYSKFMIPDSFDPLADKYDLEYSKRESVLRPKGEFNSIRYFVSRIIKQDGRVLNAEYDFETQSEIVRYSQLDHTFYSWTFDVKGIEPGDELEIQYAYENVYNAKTEYRVYFNGELAKQNYSLKMRHTNGNLYFFQYHNGAEAQDSSVNRETSPETYEYAWTRKNLDGHINEKGARIHKELPFVTFYQHHSDYNDKGMEVLYDARQLPYSWEFVYRSLIKYYPKNPGYFLNKPDKTSRAFKKYFLSHTDSLADTSACTKFIAIHQDIANNFDYDYDREFLEGDDQRLERIPEFLEKKMLRSSSRYHIYDKMAFWLGSPYYCVYMYDKRYEEMDFDCFYPMEISQKFYGLPYKNSYLYFHPKCSRFGYDYNELPFYFEDINAMLIPQTIPQEESYKRVQNIKYVRVRTPYSTVNDNTRNTASIVSISLDSLKAEFNTRLILNGQFSTLTRGFYLYGSMDTSINTGYYNPIYPPGGRTKLISKEMTSHITSFPFTTNFKLKYTCNDIMQRQEKRLVKISLKSFFNNVIEKVDSFTERHLTFYPDFQFTDQHKYVLKFERPVEINDTSPFNFSIHNSFGNYTCSLSKLDDYSWSLETIFKVEAEKVAPEDFRNVVEIYSQIEKLKNSAILVGYN